MGDTVWDSIDDEDEVYILYDKSKDGVGRSVRGVLTDNDEAESWVDEDPARRVYYARCLSDTIEDMTVPFPDG